MVVKKLNLRLFRQIKSTKGQFISITLMVIIALAIFISMNMVSDNLSVSLETFYEMTNFTDLFTEVVRIPQSAIEGLESIPGVSKAQGRVRTDVLFKVDNQNEKVRVRLISIPEEENILNENYIIEGEKHPEKINEVAVLQQFATARNIKVGDRITPVIAGKEYNFFVSGIIANPEYIYLMENEMNLLPAPDKFGILYISEEMAQNILGYQASFNEVVIKLDDYENSNLEEVIEDVEDYLEPYGLIRTIKKDNQLSNSIMNQELNQLDSMSVSITILFLGVAGVIIYIMLMRLVNNDRISIGVLKAIGYSNFEVLLHYLKYAVLIGIAGSVIGIILSIPIAAGFTNLYIMYMNIPILETQLHYRYFFYGFTLTIVFCIIAGYFGTRKVLKIMPSDSMKPEAPEVGGRIWIEKISLFWEKLTFSWKMVFRNMFRNKKRAIILVLGISLTYGITMVPLYMSLIWNTLFDVQYKVFQTMDYNVVFSKPFNENIIKDISKIVDSEHIEPKIEYPFELQNGWKKKTINVIALKRDTKVYNFRENEETPIFLEEKGIILSEIVAKNLNAKKGDIITLNNYLPGKDDITVKISGITEQYLGSNAYIDIDYFRSLLGEKDLVTGVYINSEDDVIEKLQDIKYIGKVESNRDMMDTFMEYMDLIIYSVGVMMIFGAILGFAIVYNVTIININERSLEISSLRVLGFEKKDVYCMISKENSIMTILGILLGIPVGRAMCGGIISSVSEDLMTIPLLIEPSTYLYTAIATVIFVVIAQLATMKKIYQIDFMDALKSRTS